MNINWKRLALVLGFILVTVGIGVTIYFVFFKDIFGTGGTNGNANVPVLPDVNGNRNASVINGNVSVLPGNLNTNAAGPSNIARGGETEVTPIASTLPNGAIVSNNGRDLLFYDDKTGKFYQISPDGRTRTLLSPDAYPGANKVTWSPVRDKVILEFPDNSKVLYDIRQKRQYTLAPEMEDIKFSPNGQRIAFKFMGDDPSDRLLVVSNFDGTEATTIEALADKATQFSIGGTPSGNVVATFQESIDADRQRVIPIGLQNENYKSFNVPGRGYEGAWAPDGQHILFSVFRKDTAYNPTLYIADGTTDGMGTNMVDLGVQTWPSKCAFSTNNAVYCAVPQSLEQGTGLFTDLAKDVPDDFYRIDLSTGQKQLIARPVNTDGENKYTAENLYLSSDESVLYFLDQRTGIIQKIQLK